MNTNIDIKSWLNNKNLFSAKVEAIDEKDLLRLALVRGVKEKVDFSGADLAGAYLVGAD
jgi:uncharacterized protein YjbI with pentapeptide repeats